MAIQFRSGPSSPNETTRTKAAGDHTEAPIQRLLNEACGHPAAQHAWLTDFAQGRIADSRGALREFALRYNAFTERMPSYLRALQSRLDDPRDRVRLRRAAATEAGALTPVELRRVVGSGIEPDWLVGVPRRLLLKRFCEAIGLAPATLSAGIERHRAWGDELLEFLRESTPAEALGAMALGVVGVANKTHAAVRLGVDRVLDLARREELFFELPALGQVGSPNPLFEIAEHLLVACGKETELRRGMLRALDLRQRFFDVLREHTRRPAQASLNSAAATPQELYARTASAWMRDEPDLLTDFTLEPFLLDWCEPVSGSAALELGCGAGYATRRLRERGARRVVGIDSSAEMIRLAFGSPGAGGPPHAIEYRLENAADLQGLETSSFDLVLAIGVFNELHQTEMERAFRAVRRVLRPEGRFVFGVPHPYLTCSSSGDGGRAYFRFRDWPCEGRLRRKSGAPLPTCSYHKTFEDYFHALQMAGFPWCPEVHEIELAREGLPAELEPPEELLGLPLHLAFRVEHGG